MKSKFARMINSLLKCSKLTQTLKEILTTGNKNIERPMAKREKYKIYSLKIHKKKRNSTI
jgi:hypothetical protein